MLLEVVTCAEVIITVVFWTIIFWNKTLDTWVNEVRFISEHVLPMVTLIIENAVFPWRYEYIDVIFIMVFFLIYGGVNLTATKV